ncbi:hypothetical protein AGABI2DRAFT_203958 [Agaricus bisporus var. bisporus H97]|uniref:hypothetical protein n=1 Tax=Agaricus bisporus var. bisporus (strain H97 / ATCC MYA-4626 / FGSC 10389) TaxID=936046 RepID=UPI00029F63D1|nr:hypothetical protein AGABI2DRAFT_203958 [Agaricus bisporus var. bisporus H97]EKV47114.1 hypothetical protein AGABI2DRAFT_203958 [Agaricus bisporus var. bisporus H97]
MPKCILPRRAAGSIRNPPGHFRRIRFSTSRPRCSEPQDTTRHEALTLQHKAENLLEPVFKVIERPSGLPRTTAIWRDILSDTFENLSSAVNRPARVVVFGVDAWSGAQDLVTALLEEPLGSDQAQKDALHNRWERVNSSDVLTISAKRNDEDSSIHLSSPFLRQFSIPLEITELRPSLSTWSKLLLPASFYKADVPILVFNPLTTPLSALKTLNVPSHTLFVASQSPHLNNTTLQRDTLSELFPQSSLARLLFSDPPRAIAAVQTFRSNPTSAIAIQQYQDNFTTSGISLVAQVIRDVVDSGAKTSSPAAYLRNRTAVIQLHDTLNALKSNIQDIQRNLDDIRQGVYQLSGKVEEAKVRIPRDILISDRGPTSAVGQDAVKSSLTLASKEAKGVLEKLSWWRTIWRLILHSGRLSSLQQEFTKSAVDFVNRQTSTLSNPSYPLFPAHILENKLSQIISSPTYTLTPLSLALPIAKRKSQLLKYSTTRLHLKAQQLLLGMSIGTTGGSGITWAGWMGYLMQSAGEPGTGIWNVVGMGMDPMTGIGVGLLGIVGSVRWAVGGWEREKKKWWVDWERIGQGLERDLKIRVDDVVREQVTVVATEAHQGLAELCDKRQGEVDKVNDDIAELRSQLESIISRTLA